MEKNRNLGLDSVRSIAIILVLLCHASFFDLNVDIKLLTYMGVLSVEIFFVLSGFLIGRVMIATLVETCTFHSLKIFYVNRWLRTLPIYYLFLFITAIVKKQQIPISCFFFVHNFDERQLGFFPVSWSLSIEEWFYLIVPFILLIAIKTFAWKCEKGIIFCVVSLCLCVIFFVIRICTVVNNDLVWDYNVRKQIFLRLDAIMMGVILSGLKVYAKDFYNKIAKNNYCLVFSLGGIILLGVYYTQYLGIADHFNKSKFWQVGLFSLLPFLGCFFLMYMEMSEEINVRLKKKKIANFISDFSILSYGLYLIHWNIFEQVAVEYKGWSAFVVSVVISIIIAKILNVILEKPIMNFRKRLANGI